MSDFSIPGVGNSKYDTKGIIEASMKVERIPLDRMTGELARSKEQKAIWQELNTGLSRVRDSAAELFGFQNPFQEKSASSTDEAVLTATATREAGDESRQIVVKRLAAADRLLSRPVDRGFRVESGRYAFRIAEKEVAFTFGGGSITEFVDAVNKRVGADVRASLIKDTKDSQVLLIESRSTGAANRLEFRDKARDLAVAAGMVVPTDEKSLTLGIRDGAVQATAAQGAAGPAIRIETGELTVRPGGRARIPVSPAFALDANMVLELEVKTVALEHKPWEPPQPPPGPDLPEGESVAFRGVDIRNAPSRMPLPPYTPPQPPQLTEDMRLLSFESRGKSVPLPEVPLSAQWKRLRIPIGELGDSLGALVVDNPNTYREIAIRDVRVFDTTSRGDTRPLNALSQAGDAELSIDGVAVTRDSNTVADLLPGVTLTLRGTSGDPVGLTVLPNTTLIKDKIIAFVGRYNQALTDIDVLTRRDGAVVDQAYYATDAEREKAQERLGLLAGDMTLSRLKSQLTTTMMNAYRTSGGQEIALLAQIGIATNTQGAAGAVDATRLRGYLDINEPKLETALRDRTKAVQQLFGSDSDGDLVVDAGVAFEIDRTLRAYVGRAGIISQRTGTIDTEIAQRNRQIERENTRLADTEAQLRQKYAVMEGALKSLEDSSKRLDSFNQAGK